MKPKEEQTQMNWETKNKLIDQLEKMVDETSLADVLESLAELCVLKAEHLESNWQDRRSASVWTKDARRIETVLANVHRL